MKIVLTRNEERAEKKKKYQEKNARKRAKARENFNKQCNLKFKNATLPPDFSDEYVKICLSK